MVTRREFLGMLGGGIVGLAVGGALGYTLAPKGPSPEEMAGKLPGVPSEPLKIGGMWFLTGKFGTSRARLTLRIRQARVISRWNG